MIDFHCHLDLYSDPKAVVAECVRRRTHILSVTTVPSAFDGTAALVPSNCSIYTAVGLHPELAVSREHELPLFERLLERTKYVGEVGLDGSPPHRATLPRQQIVLQEILTLCARAGGRIITLHSRGATGALLDMLARHEGAGRFVLHWFSGTPKEAARASEMGCWFSIGPAMLGSARGLSMATLIPRDRVLPETDGPFGQYSGKALMPWEAEIIVPVLADRWAESVTATQRLLAANFRQLTGIEEIGAA